MGLNPHLINLMSLRERQRLDTMTSAPRPLSPSEASFAEALEESLAAAGTSETDAENLSEPRRLLDAQSQRRFPHLVDGVRPMNTAQMVNVQRLQQRYVGEFLTEHDLVLAAQQTPASRYRTNPDDDTSGETETAANVRPIR